MILIKFNHMFIKFWMCVYLAEFDVDICSDPSDGNMWIGIVAALEQLHLFVKCLWLHLFNAFGNFQEASVLQRCLIKVLSCDKLF